MTGREHTLDKRKVHHKWDKGIPPAIEIKSGDTVHCESEVLELRDSRSRPGNGIVVFRHRAFNQHDELVAICKRSALMLRRPVP